jgi:hypothetical protein
MNTWLAITLGFCLGFVAATVTWVLVSLIATYTSATATDKIVEEEVERREAERERLATSTS